MITRDRADMSVPQRNPDPKIYTLEEYERVKTFLSTHQLSAGLGSLESPCSIALLNLSLYGYKVATTPPGVSRILVQWIIVVQDAMTDRYRNSEGWKQLVALVPWCSEDQEQRHVEMITEWVWTKVAEQVQPTAEEIGVGSEWQRFTMQRTREAAKAVSEKLDWCRQPRVTRNFKHAVDDVFLRPREFSIRRVNEDDYAARRLLAFAKPLFRYVPSLDVCATLLQLLHPELSGVSRRDDDGEREAAHVS